MLLTRIPSKIVLFIACILLVASCDDKYDEGYNEGFSSGERAGYTQGYRQGKDAGYTEGYKKGKRDGKIEGYSEGKEEGLSEGYSDGTQVFVKDTFAPTLGTTIIVILSIAFSYFFIKYSRDTIFLYLNSLSNHLSNLWRYLIFRKKLISLESVATKRAKLKSKIYSAETYLEIQNIFDDEKLESELTFIYLKIVSILTRSQILDIKENRNKLLEYINEIHYSKIVDTEEKKELFIAINMIIETNIIKEQGLYNTLKINYKSLENGIEIPVKKKKQIELFITSYYFLIYMCLGLLFIMFYFS
jgi:hypothetical protein